MSRDDIPPVAEGGAVTRPAIPFSKNQVPTTTTTVAATSGTNACLQIRRLEARVRGLGIAATSRSGRSLDMRAGCTRANTRAARSGGLAPHTSLAIAWARLRRLTHERHPSQDARCSSEPRPGKSLLATSQSIRQTPFVPNRQGGCQTVTGSIKTGLQRRRRDAFCACSLFSRQPKQINQHKRQPLVRRHCFQCLLDEVPVLGILGILIRPEEAPCELPEHVGMAPDDQFECA